MGSNRRILIVRVCAIGDFILNIPALRAIAAQSPDAAFTLVGNPDTLSLAGEFIPVAAVHSIESPPWNRLFVQPLPNLNFDSAWIWMKDPTLANHLRESGIGRVFHYPAFPPPGIHAAEYLLSTVGLPAPALPDLWIPGSAQIWIHPGSGGSSKCWPNFAELARVIPEAMILTGPCESFASAEHRTLKGLSLQEVSKRIRMCRMFIGNDSGITHLAAYWGCPTLALFGPTDPQIWGPIGRRVKIIRKQPLTSISIEDIRNHL
jgi:ADP-heptose:LPS heptosyltransferase